MEKFIIIITEENNKVAILIDAVKALSEINGAVRIDFIHPEGHLVKQPIKNSFDEVFNILNGGTYANPISKR